jgi:S-DNA-T family DNA segregation ATPase FtsK/SpoIIIE
MDKFRALEENIAHLLQIPEPPIMFPIYERSIVAIDVVNRKRTKVHLIPLLTDVKDISQFKLPTVLGYTVYGSPFVIDLAESPHMLVAGTTGSGKSIGLRSIITSLLHFNRNVEMLMIDPKAVELSIFDDLGHACVVTDINEVDKVFGYVHYQIENRYERFRQVGVSNIVDAGPDCPYIVLVIDELADLFQYKKSAKDSMLRITQKSRAAGVHVVAATQRPSVDIISGVIKSNFPTRMAYKVSSPQDSRTILGDKGAERLLGNGDALYRKSAGSFERVQGAFVANDDIVEIIGKVL